MDEPTPAATAGSEPTSFVGFASAREAAAYHALVCDLLARDPPEVRPVDRTRLDADDDVRPDHVREG